MRILFIKQLFNPEPTAKSLDFATELVKRGHNVEVLTGFPSYPAGKIYPGYSQKLWQREVMDGVNIIRVPIFPSQDTSGYKRILHYLSYAISASIVGPFLTKKADVAFVYQGAIPVGIPAMVNRFLKGTPFLYDINDLWPETVTASGMLKSKLLLRIIGAWSNMNYRKANFVSVATEGFKNELLNRNIDKEKIAVVSNWSRNEVTPKTLSIKESEQIFPRNCLNILYAGNLGPLQSLFTLLHVAKRLKESKIDDIKFVLLGAGSDADKLKKYIIEHELNNCQILPRVDSSEVTRYINSADVLFVHLKKTPLFEITIPSKILATMKAGKAILLGVKGDAKKIIDNANCGICFEPENEEDLLSKILKLSQQEKADLKVMGENGKLFYDEKLSFEASVDKLESIMKTLVRDA